MSESKNNIKLIKPTIKDISSMANLVKEEVQKGIILYRSYDEIASNISSYTLIKIDNILVGYCALHIHTINLAEIRSLIIAKEYRSKGYSKLLINNALTQAKKLNLKKVLVLTYEKILFEKLGFYTISKDTLPKQKIFKDCINCKSYPICDEIALIYDII